MKVNLADYKVLCFVIRKDCSFDTEDLRFVNNSAKEFCKRNLSYVNQIAENEKTYIKGRGKIKKLAIEILKALPDEPGESKLEVKNEKHWQAPPASGEDKINL